MKKTDEKNWFHEKKKSVFVKMNMDWLILTKSRSLLYRLFWKSLRSYIQFSNLRKKKGETRIRFNEEGGEERVRRVFSRMAVRNKLLAEFRANARANVTQLTACPVNDYPLWALNVLLPLRLVVVPFG